MSTAEETDADSGESEPETEMVETSVGESGVDPDGFFDDVEKEATTGDDVSQMFDGVDESQSAGGSSSDSSPATMNLADDINRGVARAAVIGLDDEWETDDGETQSKDDLQTEFEETFEAFRLGHYAGICLEEYVLQDAEDIHPVWGLLGAALICSAVIVYRRPDGDQLIDETKLKLGEASLPEVGPLSDDTTSEDNNG